MDRYIPLIALIAWLLSGIGLAAIFDAAETAIKEWRKNK